LLAELNILFRVRHQLVVIYERERLFGKSINAALKSQSYEVFCSKNSEEKKSPHDLDASEKLITRDTELSKLGADEEQFILSSDLSLKITVLRKSCLYSLYTMGTVDSNGGLLLLSSLLEKYPVLADLRSFPRNILSFEITESHPDAASSTLLPPPPPPEPSDSTDDSDINQPITRERIDSSSSISHIQQTAESESYLESSLRDPALPFECNRYRVLYRSLFNHTIRIYCVFM
jgi:hypothetical protein